MNKNIIAQKVEFDKSGWPINPATGKAYTRNEIVANPTLPYPQHVDPANPGPYWRRRTAEELAAAKARPAQKTKARSRRRPTSKRRVFTNNVTFGFFEQQAKVGQAMAELVDRVNGRQSGDDNSQAAGPGEPARETRRAFVHCGNKFEIMEW